MRNLLVATAALGLASSAATAAPLQYTVWSGTGLSHTATFPVPTTDLIATFQSSDLINFDDTAPNGSPNTFGAFFGTSPSVLAAFIAAPQSPNPNATMSTLDGAGSISTFMRITGSYNVNPSSNPLLSGSIDHDDGGQIFVDGNSSTGVGATFVCGNPSEATENAENCSFPAGSHTFTILYTEDNGSPAILNAKVPTPEPASLGLLGVGLLGLGFVAARRRR